MLQLNYGKRSLPASGQGDRPGLQDRSKVPECSSDASVSDTDIGMNIHLPGTSFQNVSVVAAEKERILNLLRNPILLLIQNPFISRNILCSIFILEISKFPRSVLSISDPICMSDTFPGL